MAFLLIFQMNGCGAVESHLENIGNDIFLALLQEGILVEIRIHLQDLGQNLRHLGFGEQPT